MSNKVVSGMLLAFVYNCVSHQWRISYIRYIICPLRTAFDAIMNDTRVGSTSEYAQNPTMNQ